MEYTTQRSTQIGVPTLWQSNSLPTPSPIPSGQDLKTASSMVGDATTGKHQHLMPTKTGPRPQRFAIMERVKRYSITIYWLCISKMNYVKNNIILYEIKDNVIVGQMTDCYSRADKCDGNYLVYFNLYNSGGDFQFLMQCHDPDCSTHAQMGPDYKCTTI